MARIPFPDLTTASQEVRAAFDAMPFDLAVMRMFAHAEGGFTAWLQFAGGVLGKNTLDEETQELAVCVVTAADSPRYEYAHHRPALLSAGLSDKQVAAIESGQLRSVALSERQRAVAVFVREVQENVRASDDALAEVLKYFTHREVIELILCAGLYMLNSRVAENSGITLDDDRMFAKSGQFIPDVPDF